ncbi:TetR family transcriptional regulator [Mycolicibacterium sp. CH28]|uniref:TetR/AcrR family transcriptional regulator n=1 Tax=Mycolicibacterium sp. CH28 TaxID=2512237 RepID=UPI0010809FC8|nr:TetR/AcrR family transcriptional regulator [Mycolicibacterium sp. CH28]TGD84423.1 TetR family transcriptional regulator [Mycolicibacterium sp. CH28]
MTMSGNLHDQRRRSTRDALRRVALDRFAHDGFANVTVTELAEEAGVTERTFFRHFPTKEAVLFADYETHFEWFAEALERRPKDEPMLDAVLAAMDGFPHDLEVVRQAALARASLIDGDRAAGHIRLVQSSFATVVTDFVRDRYRHIPNVDLVAEVAGATVAAALIVALQMWGRDGCEGDLSQISAESLELLRSGLAPLN